ncbi:MAG: glyoxalase [Bacteroidota bacterium]
MFGILLLTTLDIMNREKIKELRPNITAIDKAAAVTPEERFQNQVLRPILKFQNLLLLKVYQHYLIQRKRQFHKLSNPKEKLAYIEHSVQKDSKLRELLLGLVIGYFTVEEYDTYLENEKPIRKRIIDLLVQRLQDQMDKI